MEREKRVFFPVMKKILIFSGVAVLLLSAVLIWRVLNPPLSDEQQIAAHLNAIAAAASARDAGGVANFLAPTVTFNGNPGLERREVKRQIYIGISQYRDVDLSINGVQVQVNGERANSDGRFALSLKREFESAPELQTGDFQLKWQKMDGDWKIVEVEGKIPQNF